MRHDLEVLADIFSANSTAALTFNDPYAAQGRLLATLHAKQHITAAAFLYSADGKVFANYRRDTRPWEKPPRPRSWRMEAGSIRSA